MPDAGGNRLIVVGETNELAAVEEIARKLDKVSAQSASARVFKIKSADPEKVAEILTSSLVHYDAYGRPQKRVSVSVDAKTRTLIVTGDPKELQGVALIIEQLDQSLGTQLERKMKVVTLKQGKVADLSSKVRQLYNDRVKSQPELGTADPLILDEEPSNQLILAGSESQLKVMGEIIEELQSAQVARSTRETKMLELGSAEEMTRLLPLLTNLYKDHMRGRDASDPPDAQIIPDERNARLIITARTNHIAEIENILQQLRGGKTEPEERDTRVYDLTTASAVELTATVRTLYQDQAKTRPGAPAADTLIQSDSGANRIIVTGATNELAVVEEIIKKLDKVGSQSPSARVFKVKSADPEKVVEILGTALVRYDAYGRAQKRVSVVTDPKTRTIIATGDPKELQAAAVIIEQLDSSLGEQPGRAMRVIAVKERQASELSTKVREIYQDQARNQPELGTSEPLILADATSNQLIMAGTEKQLAALEQIALVLQKGAGAATRQARVFPLERASARSVVAMLSQIFANQIASAEPSERMVVSSGGNDRTLVVEAPEAALVRVEELIKSLEQSGPEGLNVIQTVRLNKGRAEDMAEAVNHAITNSSPVTARRVSVTPVAGANSLLINGPTNAVQEVMRIIHELDQDSPGSGDIQIRIYKLENGAAKEVSALLQQMLQSVTRNLRGLSAAGGDRRVPDATVTLDDRSNSLIVSGTEAHFKVVEKILPTLDKAPERSNRDVQFVWLRKAKAYDVSNQLDTLFEDRPRSDRPVIEPDIQGNSLTIIAKRGDLAQIQDLIARLDEQGKASALQVRLRPLDHVAAEQMAKMLESIYPQMSGTPVRVTEKLAYTPDKKPVGETNALEVAIAVDKSANALILSGPAQELDNVDRLIADLSQNFYGNESEFRLFSIKEADPVIVANALTALLRQEAVAPGAPGQPPQVVQVRQRITVVAEPRTRSVIVRARPTDFALMESLIKQLDTAGQAAQLEFRLVLLTNAPPEKAFPLVQQMVAQLTATRPGESVTVGLDARSRGLVVFARDTMLSQVEKIIHSLDVASPNLEAEVRIISLRKANAVQLAVVLQNMLKPGAQGEATAEARELQEQVTRLKIVNDLGEPVTLDLTKPIKIATDPATGAGGGNRLVLTSTPDNLRALASVVELMDSVPVIDGIEVRFVRLEYADATAVSTTLTTIFTQGRQLAVGPSGPGAEPAGEGKALVHPLNVAVDSRANTIILSGRPESLDLALKVVRDLDRDLKGFVTEVRLFHLKYASATRLLPMLQAVFAEGPATPGAEGLSTQVSRLRALKEGGAGKENQTPKVRAALAVQADDQANILIVAARADNLPLIADIIEQLDIPGSAGLETVRLYPLEHSEPAAVVKILNELYSSPRAATMRAEDKPIVTADPRTATVIVAGNGKAFAFVEALLKQLDQKLPVDLRDIALIPLEHADASGVAATLQKLMDARVTQRAALSQGQGDSLKVIILSDPRSNSLLVGGSREGFELVQNLAKQLDQASPALSGNVRLIPLQIADARVIATTLSSLFEQRYTALHTPDEQRRKPIILADMRANSLLVAAGQEDNRTIDDLVKRLDAKMENPALTLSVLALKHNDSAKIATAVESIFAARLKAQTLPGQTPLASEQIKLEPDPLNNALVVSASKENLILIQELVEKLDQEPLVTDGVLETFTLQFADAQRVAAMLKSLVEQGLYRPGQSAAAAAKTGSARDILSVTIDSRSNTLIVSASPANLAVVREIVNRIDSRDLAESGDARLYPLRNARAATLATTLQQFFQAQRTADSAAVSASQRAIPVAVIADDRVNAIIVTGGKEAFEFVDRMLPQLDGDSAFARLNFRVFPLKKATALKLQATLQPIFANRPPKVKGEAVDPVTIIADPWVNALLVGASVEDLTTVSSLVERLDSEPSDTGLAIHVFPLKKADAARVATTIQGLFRENTPGQLMPISVAADERINALVVSCGENDAKRIAELAKKLDTEQVSKVSEIKVFPLQYARAENLALILNTALNSKPQVNNDPNPNAQSVLQFVNRGEDGHELVTAALKESALITPDTRMNSLIVSGPVEYMGLIEQIVARLDASSPQKAKIKVFALHNADARQMGEVLSQFFHMSPAVNANSVVGGQRSVQYTLVRQADQDDEASPEVAVASATVGTAEQSALTVTIDPRTNSLLVGGSDHYVALVSQLIDSLDSSSAHERQTQVVRLKNSQAPDVATAIKSFLDQERQKITQTLGAEVALAAQRNSDQEVAVVAEQVSNTLLLSANRRYFDQILEMIEELDKPQPQVLIQVLLAEVTVDDETDLGVEWSLTGNNGGQVYSMGTSLGVANDLATLGGFSTAITGKDLNFLLRALKTQGRLEVLSRPQIVTADNKPASINVGQRVPLVDQSRLDLNNNLTTSYTYQDVGVNLTVTPKISPDGYVKMDIGMTNSDVSTTSVKINSSSSVPIIDQRRANTTVTARSGQTIIIGGLISTSDSKNIRKVPMLGDIPYLGVLFRTSTTIRNRTELLILLTPQVLANNQIPTTLQDPVKVTRGEMEHSILRDKLDRDDLQKRLLDTHFPTNSPVLRRDSPPVPTNAVPPEAVPAPR
jgi:type II secretory pathway component GspD/PulD (secretin)